MSTVYSLLSKKSTSSRCINLIAVLYYNFINKVVNEIIRRSLCIEICIKNIHSEKRRKKHTKEKLKRLIKLVVKRKAYVRGLNIIQEKKKAYGIYVEEEEEEKKEHHSKSVCKFSCKILSDTESITNANN